MMEDQHVPMKPERSEQPGEARHSRNPIVRFQRGFERRFHQFREQYGVRLEQAIAKRNRFVAG